MDNDYKRIYICWSFFFNLLWKVGSFLVIPFSLGSLKLLKICMPYGKKKRRCSGQCKLIMPLQQMLTLAWELLYYWMVLLKYCKPSWCRTREYKYSTWIKGQMNIFQPALPVYYKSTMTTFSVLQLYPRAQELQISSKTFNMYFSEQELLSWTFLGPKYWNGNSPQCN